MTWAEGIASWFLPAPCLACGELIARPRGSLGLCLPCRGRLRAWPASCAVCGRAVAGRTPRAWRCPSCKCHPPPFDRLLAVWRYAPPLDSIIAGLKFRRLDYLGAHLGNEAHAWYRSWRAGGDEPEPELVVPVPLHWSRCLVRGFNQAALIAAPMAVGLGRDLSLVLRRRRRTPQQTSLHRVARLTNPRGAFEVRPEWRGQVAGRTVLLVDDVVTTGATLAAASSALREAGAVHVTALALGRTA